MKYLIYCRKSTESEDRQVLSIPAQIEELTRLAERENIKVDRIFKESMSAKAPGRPEFNKLLELIEKNKDSVLLAWKLDRLVRNPIDAGKIAWLLQQGIIKEIKTYERSYFPTDNVLLMAVEFGMANQYIRDLSTNVKRGNRMKLERGGWTGAAPLGYLNNKADHTVYPDPAINSFIVRLFELFATGSHSLNDLSELFYSQGLRSKKGYKVHKSVLYRVIVNKFYYGIIERSGKSYQGAHQPLISKDLYDQCQRVMSGNRRKKQKHFFPLTGYLSCTECGCMLTATIARDHVYYHCTNGKKLHMGKRDHIRSEKLNDQIAEHLKQVPFDKELVELMYQASKQKAVQEVEFTSGTRINMEKQLKLLQEKRRRIEESYFDGTLPKDHYNERILALDNEQVELTNQLKQLNEKINLGGDTTIEQTKKAFLTASYAEKDFLSGDDYKKRELAEILLSNIYMHGKNIQHLQYNHLFQLIYSAPKTNDFKVWQGW